MERDTETEPILGTMSQKYGTSSQSVQHDIENSGSHVSTAYRGSVVSFHDIHYTVAVKTGPCKGAVPKVILDGVSGVFRPGTMSAIMGPTGSGKTSLLDILAGRKDPSGLQGLVLIDGAPQPANFKLMSGYVVQDDCVMGTLTVRENLMFSAALRLPSEVSRAEKANRVDQVIDQLSLQKCADTRVGNEFMRGVSGGERKRTNIGMELITSPSVLFLDEPTTGLDASTANSVMLLLKRLALSGSTIIFSIHQPRYSIYKLCDTLILLGNGETMYFGPAFDGIRFFHSLGYAIEEHDNPSDFYLDVVNGDNDHGPVANGGSASIEEKTVSVIFSSDADGPSTAHTKRFSEAFKKSEWHSKLTSDLDTIYKEYQQRMAYSSSQYPAAIVGRQLTYRTSFLKQFGIVSSRTVKNLVRNPRTSFLQVFTMCIFAAITGVIYLQVDDTCKAGVQNRVGAFFFIIMNMIFGNLSAVDLFIQERALFIHENVSGFYRVSSYFLSKVTCDLIPNRTVPVICFGVITYWMIGFEADVSKFFFFVLNLIVTTLAASALAFAISASVRINAIASLLIAMCYVFMMVFSGLLVNIKSMGAWLKWLEWLSIFRYSLQALSINELKDKYFTNPVNNSQTERVTCGNDYLIDQGTAYAEPFDLWQNVVALAGMSVVLLVLAYVQLRRIKKLK